MGALSKGLRKALPISEKPKLAWLEFQYIDIILKLAWLEFQYFNIQKITENNFSISVINIRISIFPTLFYTKSVL